MPESVGRKGFEIILMQKKTPTSQHRTTQNRTLQGASSRSASRSTSQNRSSRGTPARPASRKRTSRSRVNFTKHKSGCKTPPVRIATKVKIQIALVLAAVILIVSGINHLVHWFSGYDGLGKHVSLPENTYESSAFYYDTAGRLHYEDDTRISRTVVDVSTYQKNIDWTAVSDDGIEMAMIRLGYRGYKTGVLSLDSHYEKNVQEARSAGLDIGVYFFSQAITVAEAEEEARYVMRHVRGKHINGPIAFDMEPISGGDRISSLTTAQKTEIADAFCQLLEKNGYSPIIYGNPDWLQTHLDMTLLTDYPVWLAHYTSLTNWPYAYDMWQYTDSGKVSGIGSGVDLSIQIMEK